MRKGLSCSEAGKLGAEASKDVSRRKKMQRIEEYNKDPQRCRECGKVIPYEKKRNTYCSYSCAAKKGNKGVNRWKNSTKLSSCQNCGKSLIGRAGKKYCSRECHNQTRWNDKVAVLEGTISGEVGIKVIRKYIIKTRSHKCELCNNTEWQGKPIPLELDHIDGHSENNKLDNLRLVCPNCHALTPTYKAKNTGNGRAKRRQRYIDGKSY